MILEFTPQLAEQGITLIFIVAIIGVCIHIILSSFKRLRKSDKHTEVKPEVVEV